MIMMTHQTRVHPSIHLSIYLSTQKHYITAGEMKWQRNTAYFVNFSLFLHDILPHQGTEEQF